MGNATSIYEVARQAGVSIATVSKIINGKPRASAATIERVKRSMEDLNYIPRPQGRRPGRRTSFGCQKKTGRIAVLFMGYHSAELRVPLFTDFVHGIESTLSRHDLSMLFSNSLRSGNVPGDVERKEVDGVILVGKEPCGKARSLIEALPCVHVLGRGIAWMDNVLPDNETVGRLAADYLLERGHSNFALIEDLSNDVFAQRAKVFEETIVRAKGKLALLKANKLTVVTQNQCAGDREILGVLVDRMLKIMPRVTALFSCSDLVTATLYPLLYERKIVPGKDIEIVSCNNDLPLLGGMNPRPAIIDIQIGKIGQRAVEQLLWRTVNPGEPLMRTLIVPRLRGADT